MTTLGYVNEPIDTKSLYNESPPKVREASLRQSSDFSKLVYAEWKHELNAHDVTWQVFFSASSANRNAWRRWLDDECTWNDALDAIVHELNTRHPGASFALAVTVVR